VSGTQVVVLPTGRRYHYLEHSKAVLRADGRTHAYIGPESVREGGQRITLYLPFTWCGLHENPEGLTNLADIPEGLEPCKRCKRREAG